MLITELFIETLEGATKINAIHPYVELSKDFSYLLRNQNVIAQKILHSAQPGFNKQQMINITELFDLKISQIDELAMDLDYIKKGIMNHVQLEIMPNEALDDERIYLANGYVVIPEGRPNTVYPVFRVRPINSKLEFKMLNGKLSSLDDAIRNHVDKTIIATLAIAKNTEFYPLMETALPIVKEKYENGLRQQE